MQNSTSRKILVVQDKPAIANSIKLALSSQGHEVLIAKTLLEARKLFRSVEADLVLLDTNLPDGHGLQFCREIREEDSTLPILFLSHEASEDTVIKTLSYSTTDFMRMPFSNGELALRAKRLMKVTLGNTKIGDLVIEHERHEVSWRGLSLPLSQREYALLSMLMNNVGRLISRERMTDKITEGEVNERTFNSYLSRLKTKLEKAGVEGIRITAIYGEGYRLDAFNKSRA